MERAVVAACTEALFPAGGTIAISGSEAGVVDYFAHVLTRVPPLTRGKLRALLRFIEWSPCVFGPFKRRLSSLGLDDRRAVIRKLVFSRIYLVRMAFLGLRTVLTVAYFGDPRVCQAVGNVPCRAPFESRGVA